jgi:hypothetical protein
MYDARIGRWISPDPYGQFASPYVGMGNSFVLGIGPDGGWWCCGGGATATAVASGAGRAIGGAAAAAGSTFISAAAIFSGAVSGLSKAANFFGDHNPGGDFLYQVNKFNPIAIIANSVSAYSSGVDIYGNKQSITEATVNLAMVVPVGRIAGTGAKLVEEGLSIAAKVAPKYLYHYTSEAAAQSISKTGLRTGKDGFLYLTNKAALSPLQAQIELALPANRALPISILRIRASGLKPSIIRRVQGNLSGMGAGGGTEFLFNEHIPASLIKIIK